MPYTEQPRQRLELKSEEDWNSAYERFTIAKMASQRLTEYYCHTQSTMY